MGSAKAVIAKGKGRFFWILEHRSGARPLPPTLDSTKQMKKRRFAPELQPTLLGCSLDRFKGTVYTGGVMDKITQISIKMHGASRKEPWR